MYPVVKTFKDQVDRWWLPLYATRAAQFDWKPHNTLFVSWLGSNDVGRAYLNDWGGALESDVGEYAALLHRLYENGARNFLVMNVPPFENSPMVEKFNDNAKHELGQLIDTYNRNLTTAVTQLRESYSDATVFLFDTNTLFNQLMQDQCSMVETCPLKDTRTYCRKYLNEKIDPYRFDAECEYPLDKYFWLNTLHPSFRVHAAIANALAGYLSDPSNTG